MMKKHWQLVILITVYLSQEMLQRSNLLWLMYLRMVKSSIDITIIIIQIYLILQNILFAILKKKKKRKSWLYQEETKE